MGIFSDEKYPPWVRCVIALLSFWNWLYNILTYIPFLILENPAGRVENSKRIKAKPFWQNEEYVVYRNVENFSQLRTKVYNDVDTLDRLWERSVLYFAKNPCMGVREVLNVEREKQPNGKIFEKLNLGQYKWYTYEEVDKQVQQLGHGLAAFGHRSGVNLLIFAETQAKWMITALACIRHRIPAVTVYSTLGEEAIIRAISQTQAETIVTSEHLLEKVAHILPHCPSIRRLVYFESENGFYDHEEIGKLITGIRFLRYTALLKLGESNESEEPAIRPNADEVAFVMFSSGTTADPKGILITHANVIAATAAQAAVIPDVSLDDVYIGYLPLAHILEFDAEFCCLAHGIRIGYSSPLTLTDNASKIKRGARGDCAVLNPTLIATVPSVMDRIYKAVILKLQGSSQLRRAIFEFVYELKRTRLESGYSTPFLNRLIFSHISSVLGNRVRLILSGGAPLNPETQRFINICFCCPVEQGYGLTETCGAGTICHSDDLTTGRVGPPLSCNDIMLRNWNEGGYTIQNNPNPQGEILISGANISKGYLNHLKKTCEDFININGQIWFCSGDIGEFDSDGCLKIIDRKKDLVKLQHGEYVSVAKVETILLTCPLIDYVCVYGNSLYSYLVAIIVPNPKQLVEFSQENEIEDLRFEALCDNLEVIHAVQEEIVRHAAKYNLMKFEIPQKIYLCKEKWTVEMGFLTDALKLKRRMIENYYKDVIESLCSSKH